VGNLPEVSPGEHLRLQGQWDRHSETRSQFKAEVCEQTLPATVAGIQGYLGSGMIKGIGPKLAERIVGSSRKTPSGHRTEPERLLRSARHRAWIARTRSPAWQEQKQVKEIMVFLHGHGVSTNLAVKIYKTYGDRSLEGRPAKSLSAGTRYLRRRLQNRRPHRTGAGSARRSSPASKPASCSL
jgi:exodeoxyribonuclease V alpha subunit